MNERQRRYQWAAAGTAIVLILAAGSARVVSQPNRVDRSQNFRDAINGGRARNVILFLGDGIGDSEITIARNYQAGANGRLWMDTLPFTGEYTTYALQESNPSLIDYVTDSAASGTGWATGVKTSNGRIASVAGMGDAVTQIQTSWSSRSRRGTRSGM
jgi:alkaline phosphatase